MQFDSCIGLKLPEGVGGTMNINNRDIMLNIGTYARATKCACAYGSVQDPPTSIYPRSLASYESMLEATVHWHIRSAKEYRVPESSCPWFVALLQTVFFSLPRKYPREIGTSKVMGGTRLWKSVLSRLNQDSWECMLRQLYIYTHRTCTT